MKSVTEKVLQRLSFEKLLVTTGILPQRKRITLDDILAAGEEEPRVIMMLPAIYLHKKSIICHLERDLKKKSALKKRLQKIFIEQKKTKGNFVGMEISECQRLSRQFKIYLDHSRSRHRSLTRTFRFSHDDLSQLQTLTQQMKTGGMSETIRVLVRERMQVSEQQGKDVIS